MSTKKRSHERDPSVFPKPHESVSLQRSCYAAGSITSQSFPDFLNLAESRREKAVFVQRHNTSLHSKLRQTALKLTPKGLDHTQIDTLLEPCITYLWFWEVLGQSQSWLRTIQTDLWNWALYQFSHLWILDLLSKNQTLARAQERDCVRVLFTIQADKVLNRFLFFRSIYIIFI